MNAKAKSESCLDVLRASSATPSVIRSSSSFTGSEELTPQVQVTVPVCRIMIAACLYCSLCIKMGQALGYILLGSG